MSKLQSVELFSGSKSVSSVLALNNYSTLTVDIDKDLNPDLCIDILDLLPVHLPPRVNFFWISPDCRFFSRAGDSKNWKKNTVKYRIYNYEPVTDNARTALRLIEKVAEIISWFPNAKFVIENPIGRIHHTAALKSIGHYRYAVNYAAWGFNYSKETYLFTNFLLPLPTKKVQSKKPGLRSIRNKKHRSKVPSALIQFIINCL